MLGLRAMRERRMVLNSSNTLAKRFINKQVILYSVIVTPILVILHELIHYSFFTVIGLKAYLVSFSFTGIIGFDYTFPSIKNALLYYNTNHVSFSLAALAGPLFTYLISAICLLLYKKYNNALFWACSFNPLSVRTVAIIIMIPQVFLSGKPIDEAVFSYFTNIPLLFVVIISLLTSIVLIIIAIKILSKQNRIPYIISSFFFGTISWQIIEIIVNKLG